MKVLSETKDDGRVVELTHDEWSEFLKLACAVEGKTQVETSWDFRVEDRQRFATDAPVDYSTVFGNITAFYLAKFRLNEMQRAVDMFRESVEGAQR